MQLFKGGKYSYFAVLAANIISFIAGTSIAWSSPILPILHKENSSNPLKRKISDVEESWIASLAALGGIFGPFIFGFLVQKIGRKKCITVISVPFLVAYLIAAFAETVELFYVSRILMGVGVSGAYCMVPIYIAETSEPVNRGLLQASTSSYIMLGLLVSYCIGPYVSVMTFNLILSALCVAYVPVFWFVAPESPYCLLSKGREEEAFKSLQYLRRKPDAEIRSEIAAIKKHFDELEAASFLDIFRIRVNLKAFFYSWALITFQQFSGVYVIVYYTQNIFDATGSYIASEISSIIVGSVQFLVSLISPPFSDKTGRRMLLLIALLGAIVAEIILGIYFYLQKSGDDVSQVGWLPLFSLVMFITFYNFGIGFIPWTVMGEILPSNISSNASAIITSFFWIVGFFLTNYFGNLSDAIGMGACFWLFAGFCVLFELYVFFFMFETKGKSLKEIQDILKQ